MKIHTTLSHVVLRSRASVLLRQAALRVGSIVGFGTKALLSRFPLSALSPHKASGSFAARHEDPEDAPAEPVLQCKRGQETATTSGKVNPRAGWPTCSKQHTKWQEASATPHVAPMEGSETSPSSSGI